MTQSASHFSWRRLKALCWKETKQIVRDPSSALIAVVIPLMLLFIFGYGINLDSSKLRVGILLEQQTPQARELVDTFTGSPFIDATISNNRNLLIDKMQAGEIRGIVVIPVNFSAQLLQAQSMRLSKLLPMVVSQIPRILCKHIPKVFGIHGRCNKGKTKVNPFPP